jgi:hypothetical protein
MKPENGHTNTPQGDFYLDKWFLDVVGEHGEAMIFYSAKLGWKGWTVSYASWLRYDPATGVRETSGFRAVQAPVCKGNTITWQDEKYGVSGRWVSQAPPLQARLFDDGAGHLDWHCHQPSSKVTLQFDDGTIIQGTGYVEQLMLTVFPWKIPMRELRWGRFSSEEHYWVWIELRSQVRQQWLWVNGVKVQNGVIEDDRIVVSEKDLELQLDRQVVLESEKKIFSVVKKLLPFMPGFKRGVPLPFLLAAEHKWLSGGALLRHGAVIGRGKAIHELVEFYGKQQNTSLKNT